MDIAIVSPSPKPFAVGGIEKLMLGLYQHIDELTNHRVELFKLPTEEIGFWELLKSYKMFYEFDLSHFDMVITCKYPAWMVQHKNHTVYLAHHLRGLFDTYHFLNMPTEVKTTSYPLINDIIRYASDASSLDNELSPFFEKMDNLYQNRGNYPSDFFSFPGPIIRMIIHFLDSWALHPSRIKRYTSISKTVRERKDYFPDNVNVEVIYPPTSLSNLLNGKYDYFLVVGRLDGAKRVELVIQAMKQISNPNIKLIIAGTGPDEIRLKQLANGDNRIEFIGYINNEKLKDLYSDALAVVYVPYDEDYGLVTIEAMHCGKPVITCKDSGGTTEFVIDGVTGLIANNNPGSLADKINMLTDDTSLAMKLGANARERVQYITWKKCVESLIENKTFEKQTNHVPSKSKRKKITILSTYPVLPRKHGGQLRIYNLYKNLDEHFDVTIVSLNNDSVQYEKRMGNFTEISIPMTSKHKEKEWEIERQVGIPITDIAMQQLLQYTPHYIEIADKHLGNSDILVSAQPYLFHLLNKYKEKKYIIYDSQNVEIDLKKAILPSNKCSKKLLEELYSLEYSACKNSHLILVCSSEDSSKMQEIYRIPSHKLIIIPNGVDTTLNSFVDLEHRRQNKKELQIENEKIVAFIGSWHKPNLEAVEEILKISVHLPEYKFIIMGGVGEAFKNHTLPINVVFTGIVDEQLKKVIYSVVDIAINPMKTGSGTNLKLAEYLANGVPVISTRIGTRGYSNNSHIIISDIDEFSDKIKELINNQSLMLSLSSNGRVYIEENYSWKKISQHLLSCYQKNVEINES